MIILAIETSCDDTGVAVLKAKDGNFRVLSNIISSQIEIHSQYGGVVPNLAARAHLSNIETCLKKALIEAKNPKIDLIAVTKGPGLMPSLLVGVNFAKAIAYNWQKPVIGINHIEAHLYANWISPISVNHKTQITKHKKIQNSKLKTQNLKFPTLCLLVSGGHTQLILMKNHGKYEILGETRDDATGEAFDKVAQMLKLGYPGGPYIAQKAEQYKKTQNPTSLLPLERGGLNPTSLLPLERGGLRRGLKIPDIEFARPMINSKNYDFSFSGIKTSVLYKIRDLSEINDEIKAKISYKFQQAVIDVLIHKTIKAAKEYQAKTIMLSGGVAANKELRKQMEQKIQEEIPKIKYHIPDLLYCTDNAAMVAAAAYFRQKEATTWNQINADANLKLVD